jgi:hypothetical protein
MSSILKFFKLIDVDSNKSSVDSPPTKKLNVSNVVYMSCYYLHNYLFNFILYIIIYRYRWCGLKEGGMCTIIQFNNKNN